MKILNIDITKQHVSYRCWFETGNLSEICSEENGKGRLPCLDAMKCTNVKLRLIYLFKSQ